MVPEDQKNMTTQWCSSLQSHYFSLYFTVRAVGSVIVIKKCTCMLECSKWLLLMQVLSATLPFSHATYDSWEQYFSNYLPEIVSCYILNVPPKMLCLCGGCKMSPRTSSLCSHIFLVLRDHWLYACLHLKMEFRTCARGRQWCGIFHYHWWTASIKPRLLFSHSGLVSWGLPFLQFNHIRCLKLQVFLLA